MRRSCWCGGGVSPSHAGNACELPCEGGTPPPHHRRLRWLCGALRALYMRESLYRQLRSLRSVASGYGYVALRAVNAACGGKALLFQSFTQWQEFFYLRDDAFLFGKWREGKYHIHNASAINAWNNPLSFRFD